MANGWNSESDREALLRRVAIVLSCLPGPVASRLLRSIGDESKKAVRRTMTSLVDVDPLERQRALQAFKVSVEKQPHQADRGSPSTVSNTDPMGQTLGTSATSRVVPSTAPKQHRTAGIDSTTGSNANATSATPESSPLRFLSDVDDNALVNLLAVEHPQTVAMVLASIAPSQAARILPRLDPRLQSDSLSRIGRLGDIPEPAVAEVAEHFKKCLSHQSNANRSSEHPSNDWNDRSGRRALDAILAAMPSPPVVTHPVSPRPPAPTPSQDPGPLPAESLEPKGNDLPAHRQTAAPASAPVAPISFPSADIPAIDLTHKLRLAQDTWPENAIEQDAGQATSPDGESYSDPSRAQPPSTETMQTQQSAGLSEATTAAPHENADQLDSTDAIHQHLLSLTPLELCQALGKVETREAMLALCGLPNEVTEAALAVLPRAHAKKVRIKINALGSLHLREIDEAKEKVARVALATAEQLSNRIPMAA